MIRKRSGAENTFDKEKIEKENAERYERIKRERGWVKEEQ